VKDYRRLKGWKISRHPACGNFLNISPVIPASVTKPPELSPYGRANSKYCSLAYRRIPPGRD
jgi:hypothetical protein